MASRKVAAPIVVALLIAGVATVGGSFFSGSEAGVVPDPSQTEPASGVSPRRPADRVFRVYLDPSGQDSNGGRSPQDPIRSLARAHELLRSARPTTDVEVRIAQGTYVAPPTTWRFYVPNHTVTFLPVDYHIGGDVDSFGGRPVFRGNGESGFWFTARPPSPGTGLDARLRFYYLQVEEYDRGGILMNGGTIVSEGMRRPAGDGLNDNTIIGMYFTRLGSHWSATNDGYGGVDLVNSRRNTVKHNHFVSLQNREAGLSLIHGVYLAHHSNENVVESNRFEEISGDPIRVRNDSNDNEIVGNEFHRTGRTAQFSDWFCDSPCAQRYEQARECASHGNVFSENENVSGYFGNDVPHWTFFQAGPDYPGGPGCDNDGEHRIR
jgi:hypothetical protein